MDSNEVIECLKILLNGVKPMGRHTKIEYCNSGSVEFVIKSAIEWLTFYDPENTKIFDKFGLQSDGDPDAE